MNIQNWRRCAAVLLSAFALAVHAQAPVRDQEAEMKAATDAARTVAKQGPADIALKDQATLKLPEGYTFIPQPEADQLLRAMGNGADPRRIGIILRDGSNAFVVARYYDSGYVKDEEAKDWQADELLNGLKEGTEEGNKERAQLGIPPVEIVGWVETPAYDAATHQLVWSIETREKNASADDTRGINYNTYVLGREGYLSLNLVTTKDAVGEDKYIASSLLKATSFNDGKTYADFNASTDKVAEYGIAALVAGAAAKKLGFFAVIAAFLVKFAKVIGIAVVGLIAVLGGLFKKKTASVVSGTDDAGKSQG
ncbi:MAG TPA: DUF2167 domain-containing protein [Noviherbaspirillum sp.]|nr:DUF2167 domain-containing protein [Noviherbaspirillum sp.]